MVPKGTGGAGILYCTRYIGAERLHTRLHSRLHNLFFRYEIHCFCLVQYPVQSPVQSTRRHG
jgi:hypothetical protein